MADFGNRHTRPRTMARTDGTPRPGRTPRPGGPPPLAGTPHPGGTPRPGEPEGGDEGVERTEHWIQFTERLMPGYSRARYDAWSGISIGERWPEQSTDQDVWRDAGPSEIGGRITCLAAFSGKPRTLLAGAACGGLWQRTEGESWVRVKSPAVSNNAVDRMHNIGALAVDPNDPRRVYCGTGHAYHAGDSFPGVGIFRSEDCGVTWEVVADADGAEAQQAEANQAEADKKGIPRRISSIAVDPTSKNRILIGGVKVVLSGTPNDQHPGMFLSSDYGKTWRREDFQLVTEFAQKRGVSQKEAQALFLGREYQCHSIVWANSRWETMVLAAISGVLDWSGIWRGRYDESKCTLKWEQLTRGLPPGREFGRTNLTFSGPDDTGSRVIYAFVGAADGRCLGVFRSRDNGEHWGSPAGQDYFAACGNLNYTNCIAVSPDNPDLVVCGADDLYRSIDGGQTWTQVTEWFAKPETEAYAHKDHQTLLWTDDGWLYSGNDGGVARSKDNGIRWQNLNKGLAITMFYDIDVAPSFGTKASKVLITAGGTQDNASVMVRVDAPGIGFVPTERGLQASATLSAINSSRVEPRVKATVGLSQNTQPDPFDFGEMLYGDGGWVVFDPKDPLHLYGSSQYMEIYRHRKDDGWFTVTPEDATDEERGKIWMAYIAMNKEHPEIVFTGSTRVWRTQNDGDDWKAVSDHLDGSAISAIEIADMNPNVIYVGTENGNIFKSIDGGNRWSDRDGDDTPRPMKWREDIKERRTVPFGRAITRIEARPDNTDIVVATMLGFDAEEWYRQAHLAGGHKRKPLYPHVIWFDDKEKKWKDADPSGHLPDVHHNVVTWGQTRPYPVFVANDCGVWMSRGLETNEWINISANLPNVIVTDLVYHQNSNSLVAATYGRSTWWLTNDKLSPLIEPPA